MNKDTLTVQEVADYLRVSRDLVYALVREKKIPCIRIGRRVIFRKETVEDWMINEETKFFTGEA